MAQQIIGPRDILRVARLKTNENFTELYAGGGGGGGGTVTSVSGAGTVSGITLTGTVTSSGSLTLGGVLSATSANITNFSEAVDDRVASLLVAGSNITLTYNDVANTLTIAAAGGAPVSGTATITVGGQPGGTLAWEQTVAAVGLVVGDRISVQLAPPDNALENEPEMLNIAAISAACLTDDTMTVTMAFGEPTIGPISLIYGVM